MWMGRAFQRVGGGQLLREGPVAPGPALGPDDLQSGCAGGPEATGWRGRSQREREGPGCLGCCR